MKRRNAEVAIKLATIATAVATTMAPITAMANPVPDAQTEDAAGSKAEETATIEQAETVPEAPRTETVQVQQTEPVQTPQTEAVSETAGVVQTPVTEGPVTEEPLVEGTEGLPAADGSLQPEIVTLSLEEGPAEPEIAGENENEDDGEDDGDQDPILMISSLQGAPAPALAAAPAMKASLMAAPAAPSAEPAATSSVAAGGSKITVLYSASAEITPEKIAEFKEANGGKEPTMADLVPEVGALDPNKYASVRDIPASDLIIQGDMKIAVEGTDDYDSQTGEATEVKAATAYTIKADLDVTAVKSTMMAAKAIADDFKQADAGLSYVDGLSSIFHATFDADDAIGTFYVSNLATREERIEDYKNHYQLTSDVPEDEIYEIDWDQSVDQITANKVSITMTLKKAGFDLPASESTYSEKYALEGETFNNGPAYKSFWDAILNKVDPDSAYSKNQEYAKSTFGNLIKIVQKSPNVLSLLMHNFTTKSDAPASTGSVLHGTLSGTMSADVGARTSAPVSFEWGAIQDSTGKDGTQDASAHNVQLSIVTPAAPVTPVTPSDDPSPAPEEPAVSPVAPEPAAPVIVTPAAVPVQPEVLGVSRPLEEAASEGVVLGAVRSRQTSGGAVLGASRNVPTGDDGDMNGWGAMMAFAAAALAGWYAWERKHNS